MLKVHKGPTFNYVTRLIQKRPGIIVTNACNLSCGGCYAHCGKFAKEKLWFISLDQFLENLEYIISYMYSGKVQLLDGSYVDVNVNFNSPGGELSLIGGEPTIHPEWGKFWEIMTTKYNHINFVVSTNGRIKLPSVKNIAIYQSYKTRTVGVDFVPTLVAPIDLCDNKDKEYYFHEAEHDCNIWRNLTCVNPIYKNKISFCSSAASWDDLLDLDLSWNLTPGENPFAKLTDEDVLEKARKVCYRCGLSKKIDLPEQQMSNSYDLVTETNLGLIKKHKPYKLVYKEDSLIKISELKNAPQNYVQLDF